MRYVRGFVCVVSIGQQELLFGPNVNLERCLCENFETNGLRPFTSRRLARQGALQLVYRPDFENLSIQLARLQMEIAESSDEWPKFTRGRSWVVIFNGWGGQKLIGRLVENRPAEYPLPGAPLALNGLEPIPTIQSAQHIAYEWARQGDSRTQLATFKLTRLQGPSSSFTRSQR
jgi:hypothetical protein